MSRYRRRYLTEHEFSSYCSEMNVELRSFNQELELYEREGVLLPIARIVKPSEYISQLQTLDQQSDTFGQRLPEWDKLERLLYFRRGSNLWHPFDWEFEQQNEYLLRPSSGNFTPWEPLSATHYYHYWQVHQVYEIQNKYPIFAKNYWVFQALKEEEKYRADFHKPDNSTSITTLHGKAKYFDALSFYTELDQNEEEQTFSSVPEANGFKELSQQEFQLYKQRLANHAKIVLERYNLTIDELYDFLVYLLSRQKEYQRAEYVKLSEELEKDIIFLIRFIANKTNQSFIQLEEEVGKRYPHSRKRFRHLNKVIEIYDCTKETFERLLNKYNANFPGFEISITDIDKMLSFIEKKGIFILPYAVFDIDKTFNNSRTFLRTSLYISLSNLTIGLENYLHEIAKSNPSSNLQKDTLHNLIQTLFGWGNQFKQEHEIKKKTHQNDAMKYVIDVYTDPNLDNVIKAFLIAYRSRNHVAHNYVLNDELYFSLYGLIYTEICNVIFYSWKYALQNRWVA